MRHAEILEGGELCTEPLRDADARDRLIVRGRGPETWSPRFTFHGFRYAEISDPSAEVVAEVCHSDLRRTGWFECSVERVNRLHENVVWGMRGNFLDVPTDCPQRDERLGWTARPRRPARRPGRRAHRRRPGGQRLVLPHRRAHGRGGRVAR